jgi:hypothetical protein
LAKVSLAARRGAGQPWCSGGSGAAVQRGQRAASDTFGKFWSQKSISYNLQNFKNAAFYQL